MDSAFSSVSALPLRIVLRGARDAGVDVDGVLAEAGITEERLASFHARLTFVEVAAICTALDRSKGSTAHALHALGHVPRGAFRMVESLGLACGTIRKMAGLTGQLARLIGDGIGFELREEGREAAFVHIPHPGHPIPPLLSELAMVAAAEIARRLAGRELRASEVRFTHARPAHASQLEAFFGAPVTFGASEISLRFPAIYLDLPLRKRASGEEDLEARARAFVEELPSEEGLRSRLRAWVALRLEDESPELTEAARDLGLSPRTLQRRLQDFGTSFQNELDALRRQMVQQRALVAPSVGALAASLGFRDVSAFTRAFRRWTGESPRGFRSRLRLA